VGEGGGEGEGEGEERRSPPVQHKGGCYCCQDSEVLKKGYISYTSYFYFRFNTGYIILNILIHSLFL
jgi:hypothetical protein